MSHAHINRVSRTTAAEGSGTYTFCFISRDYVSQLYGSAPALSLDFTIYQCFEDVVACCSTMS